MKVALLFYGLARSLKYTITQIRYNIFDVLNKNGIEFDIYFHTYFFNKEYTNNRANEINIRVDNQEYKLLSPNYFSYDYDDEIRNTLRLEQYHTHRDIWITEYKTFDNFILAFYSKMKVYELMKNTNIYYDYVIYLRPDVLYLNTIPIHLFSLCNNNSVLIPNFELYFNMNDRFAIMNYNVVDKYGTIFKYMKEDSKIMSLHSEKYLYDTLKKKYELTIIYFNNFYFNRVRANGIMINDSENVNKKTLLCQCDYFEH